ncbi:hypothetical protein ACWD3Z_11725 [Streptomyces sp. NPDC002740]
MNPGSRVSLRGQFPYGTAPDKALIDLSAAHLRDASSVAAPDAVETYARGGRSVGIIGPDEPGALIHETLGGALAGSRRPARGPDRGRRSAGALRWAAG